MAIYILYTLCTKLQISLAHREEKRRELGSMCSAGRQAGRPGPRGRLLQCGGEGGSWDNHFLSGQSGRLSAPLAHGSLDCSMPSCFAAVWALGLPPQRGVVEKRAGELGIFFFWLGGGGIMKERQEGGEEGKEKNEDESKRRGEREKGCGLSPGCSPSCPPFPLRLPLQPSPSLACLTLHNGRFSAEISRYWIPGLEFCPPTMSRQRSMLQGRHTLQAKSWKTIPPFISIRKEEKSPLDTTSFISFPQSPLFPHHLSSISKLEEGYQAQSSSTRPLWLVGLFILFGGRSLKYHWENKHKLLMPIRFHSLSSEKKVIARKVGGTWTI